MSILRTRFYSVFILYVATFLLVTSCTFQKLFYHPDTTNTEIKKSDYTGEEVWLTSANGKKIHCYFVKPKAAPLATVLFLHGNAGNLMNWKSSTEALANNNFQVFIIDYQGFGKSEGTVSHKNLFADAEKSLLYLKERPDTKDTKIVVMGMSIGGHLAVSLTKKYQDKIAAMVIEGAFTTHNEIATALMPWFFKPFVKVLVSSRYKAKKNIKEIKIPKLIVHSTEDEVIPFRMGKKLFDLAPEPKFFWEIKGKHVWGMKLYEAEYISRLKKLAGVPL